MMIRTLRTWVGKNKDAVALLTDGTTVAVDLSSYHTFRQTANFAEGTLKAVALSAPKGWHGEQDYVVDGTPCTARAFGHADAASVFAALNAEVANITAAEAALAADPVANLESLLESCDWYSHMSDDPAVWPRIDRQMEKVAAVWPLVPATTAQTLWAKYAPASMACPA